MTAIRFRFLMCALLCLGLAVTYSHRACLSVAILCMTNTTFDENPLSNKNNSQHDTESDDASIICYNNDTFSGNIHHYSGPFNWDKSTQVTALGMVFWGYFLGQLPCATLVHRFKAKKTLLFMIMIMSLATILIPISLKLHVYVFFALRFIVGFTSASWFPGFYQLWSRWAPPNERGILIGLAYTGMHIGNAASFTISGALCRTGWGWVSVFYFFGIIGFIFCLIWYLLVFDGPEQNRWISTSEKNFLMEVCPKRTNNDQKNKLPLLSIFTSVPVWAFVFVVIGYDWNGYILLTSVPTFMQEVLKFGIALNSTLSALSFVGQLIGQVVFGAITDFLIARKCLQVRTLRRLSTLIGTVSPALTLIAIGFLDCRHKYFVVALFAFGLVLSGGIISGGFLSPVELSPTHSTFICAIGNSFGAVCGFVAPFIAGVMTPDRTVEQWRNVYFLGASIYVASGIFFCLFSSSSLQPWAFPPEDLFSSRQSGLEVNSLEVETKV